VARHGTRHAHAPLKLSAHYMREPPARQAFLWSAAIYRRFGLARTLRVSLGQRESGDPSPHSIKSRIFDFMGSKTPPQNLKNRPRNFEKPLFLQGLKKGVV
jgi:hypothetical protein